MASVSLPSLSSVAASSGSGLNLGSALIAHLRRNPASAPPRVRPYRRWNMSGHSSVAEPQLNATPLIDVMLVLLVILIITLPMATHAVKLNLPQGPPRTPQPSIRLDIASDGAIYWNGEEWRRSNSSARRSSRLRGSANAPRINVVPEKRTRYEVVAQVLALAQRSRVTALGAHAGRQTRNF